MMYLQKKELDKSICVDWKSTHDIFLKLNSEIIKYDILFVNNKT